MNKDIARRLNKIARQLEATADLRVISGPAYLEAHDDYIGFDDLEFTIGGKKVVIEQLSAGGEEDELHATVDGMEVSFSTRDEDEDLSDVAADFGELAKYLGLKGAENELRTLRGRLPELYENGDDSDE